MDCFAERLSSGAHSRDPLARNDGDRGSVGYFAGMNVLFLFRTPGSGVITTP